MKARVLVVDDEKSIRVTLRHFLTEDGYEVAVVTNYDEAVNMLTDQLFDIVIADIILGGRTGIDLLREIKNRKLSCPVVMITGAPDIDTASEALRLGAFDYIPKPVKRDSLLHVADMALKHRVLNHEKEKYRLHLEAIFRNINEGIITADNNLVVTEINGTAQKICGYTNGAVGINIDSLQTSCNRKCIDVLKETIDKKQPVEIYRHECSHNSHPGKVVTLTSSSLIDENGVSSGAMILIRDETRLDGLERDLQERKQLHNIVGKSDKMQNVYSLVEDLSDVDTTVLITGESGTGKELVAEALHYRGIRKDKPLVKVNCSALQEGLLESELFGHVKGAFTGAAENRAGRFQKAHGGTIFLDEIGDVSKRIQLKLLRVIQEKEFERVGDSTPVKTDVRIVAATNQDLRKKVSSGEFREDLYFRLNVVNVAMPPLRENREDIPLLVEHFLRTYNKKLERHIEGVSSEVMKMFMEYSWHGNVRELEHSIEHAFVVCHNSIITVDHLPVELREYTSTKGDSRKDREYDELKKIIVALEKSGWNKSKAARILGISRPTIYRKIKEIGISDE